MKIGCVGQASAWIKVNKPWGNRRKKLKLVGGADPLSSFLNKFPRNCVRQPDAIIGLIERKALFEHGAGIDCEDNGFPVTLAHLYGCCRILR